jgi:hypothetical protein
MGNLSYYTPKISPIVDAIYAWHKRMGDAEPERGYIGASIIGHECDRFLWYTFRGCVKRDFGGRLYRLFETGNLAEARFVKELRAIGCSVDDVDETGKQFSVSACGGHFSGHMDGCATGIPEAPETFHVLEFKTHNAKSFEKLAKEGVQQSKPQHYAQMQIYMGLTSMTRALYLAANKDTDELYAERVRYDSTEFHRLMDRADRVIRAQAPPARVAGRIDDFRCRFCDARELCWGTGTVAVPIPRKTCRTCCHATPDMDGGARWSCTQNPTVTDACKFRPLGCSQHLLLPGLISFADPVDAGDDWIEFENAADKAHWRHGDGSGDTWSTEELISGRGPMDGPKPCPLDDDPAGGIPTIPHRYPWGDSELLWHGLPDEVGETLESLGLSDLLGAEATTIENTGEYNACEFAEHAVVIITYPKDRVAAIWRGKQ